MIRNFHESDAPDAMRLWRSSQWASISASDTPEEISKFLDRNPGCSWVAEHHGAIVGTILCGHDSRRGYIYHLVVSEEHRETGIGRELLSQALEALRAQGVLKCHAMVIDGNPAAEYFWAKLGWCKQSTAQYSMILEEDESDA